MKKEFVVKMGWKEKHHHHLVDAATFGPTAFAPVTFYLTAYFLLKFTLVSLKGDILEFNL